MTFSTSSDTFTPYSLSVANSVLRLISSFISPLRSMRLVLISKGHILTLTAYLAAAFTVIICAFLPPVESKFPSRRISPSSFKSFIFWLIVGSDNPSLSAISCLDMLLLLYISLNILFLLYFLTSDVVILVVDIIYSPNTAL